MAKRRKNKKRRKISKRRIVRRRRLIRKRRSNNRRKKSYRREHHVVPNRKGGWDVKINNAGHRTYHTRKKTTAIKKARAISRKHKSELVIHNIHGRIVASHSHSTVRYGKPGPKKSRRKNRRKRH